MRAPSSAPRIKVLFLARLFGGLKSGLAAGRWEPRGVPTIYRLLEGLARDPEIDLLTVFADKEPDARFTRRVRQAIPPIGDTVVLPWRRVSGGRLRRLELTLTEAEHVLRILFIATRFKPDVVYATYANIHAAAVLARAGYRVVLRLMGVVPHHRRIAEGRAPLFRWEMRAPFAAVVSSEDGSDPAAVLPKLVGKTTPWAVRLNGCDPVAATKAEAAEARRSLGDSSRPAILFLARLEPQKGCLEFVEAALALLQDKLDCADVIVVGDGPLRSEMEKRVQAAGRGDRMHFVGAQTHAQVARWLVAADIYVSVNLYGNLSNANLEAVTAGTCLVMPNSDPRIPLDTATDRLIPADVAVRYDRNAIPGSLTVALVELIAAPEEIARRRAAAAALKGTLIKSWDEVVAGDIAQLKSLSRQPGVSRISH
ncbi:MAG: glycosyltransferase family 4 protein [Pseudolabrys sp.]